MQANAPMTPYQRVQLAQGDRRLAMIDDHVRAQHGLDVARYEQAKRQFMATHGLNERQFEQSKAEFQAGLAHRQAQLAEQRRQQPDAARDRSFRGKESPPTRNNTDHGVTKAGGDRSGWTFKATSIRFPHLSSFGEKMDASDARVPSSTARKGVECAEPGSEQNARRLRVLFVTRKWPPAVGGMELYSRELTAALARYAEVDVVALPGKADGSPPSPIMLAGFLLRAALRLAADARRYDVVQFGDFVLFPLTVWTAVVAARTTRLVSIHGLDLLFARGRGWKSRLYAAYLAAARPLQSTAHHFVANSSATAAIAAEMGFRGAVPIPLGVNIRQDLAEISDADPPTGRYVLFVGRIVPRKGLAWFSENVLPRLPADVTLRIAGTVWDRGELDRALVNPRAEYLGRAYDSALARLRRGAAVVVMPNRSLGGVDMEGFGLAALEAAADGSLLVASGIEGIVDAVIDGKTGFLLPEGDADCWAATIRELLNWTPAERAEFVAEAQRIIAERYTWDRVARETLMLGERVVA